MTHTKQATPGAAPRKPVDDKAKEARKTATGRATAGIAPQAGLEDEPLPGKGGVDDRDPDSVDDRDPDSTGSPGASVAPARKQRRD